MYDAMSNAARAEHRQMERKERANDQMDLKAVNDLLDQRDQEIKAFAEKASAEIKEHGTILSETKTVLEGLVKDGLGLQDRLQDLEQKLARRGPANDPAEVKTAGEGLVESDDFKALQTRGRGIARLNLKAVTNITSATTGTGGVGDAIQPTRVPQIIAGPDRQFTIRDLIMPGRTSSKTLAPWSDGPAINRSGRPCGRMR